MDDTDTATPGATNTTKPQKSGAADKSNPSPTDSPISKLVSVQDKLTLHTREAMLLFWGKEEDESNKFGVPGARHASGALRQIFALTARDNPFADKVLIEIDTRVELLKKLITDMENHYMFKLEQLAARGMSYSIVVAQQPKELGLGFYSPYGYMLSTVIIMYDYLVRVLKTAERRDLLTKQELHDKLYSVKHEIRSMYAYADKARRVLCADQMRSLSRADFVPGNADADAAKRTEAAKSVLGQLSNDVYAGNKSPRHTMRRERLTAAEQQLLDQVAAQLQEVTDGQGGEDLIA